MLSLNPTTGDHEVYSIQTLCDKIWQCLVAGHGFSTGTLVSFTNKTDRHDITEILLKVVLNIIYLTLLVPHKQNKFKSVAKSINYSFF
jgi:hypothetical protein